MCCDAGSCGERNSPLGHSFLSSPNFPLSYPPHLDCRWLIGGERAIRITIRVFYLNLEPGHDILRVYDGCCEDESRFVRELTGQWNLQWERKSPRSGYVGREEGGS